jgi:hypothetical protein
LIFIGIPAAQDNANENHFQQAGRGGAQAVAVVKN